MPNRILKESICTSNNLDNLTLEEEIFFYRLIVNCDDYGRMDARPAILRARLFPLRTDSTTEDHITKWLHGLAKQELIDVYAVNGQQYLQFKTWENHQQIRAKRSKYPDPDGNLLIIDSIGNQKKSSAIKCPRNPIQSNPNPIQREGAKEEVSATQQYLFNILLRCPAIKKSDSVKLPELLKDYPGINYELEFKKFVEWWPGPKKRKKPWVVLRNWLGQAQPDETKLTDSGRYKKL